jgi:hypothetical protein
VIAVVAVAGCGGGSGSDDSDATGPVVSTSTVVSTSNVTVAATSTAVPPPVTVAAADDLADGRHPAYIHGVGLRDATVTFDVIQFFVGDDAVRAAVEDGHSPDDVDDDVWIRNTNSRLRTRPISPDAEVYVLAASGEPTLEQINLGTFAAQVSEGAFDEAGDYEIFWLSVRDGIVVRIEQQFMP